MTSAPEDEPTPSPAVDPYEIGNNAGNLGHDGLDAAQKGDWIYYSNDANRTLTKIRTDGTEKTLLSDDFAGDRVYYKIPNTQEYYRVRTNGSDRQVVD